MQILPYKMIFRLKFRFVQVMFYAWISPFCRKDIISNSLRWRIYDCKDKNVKLIIEKKTLHLLKVFRKSVLFL